MDHKTLSVQRMQDYIASNINSDISFLDIVRQSYYSPWYARRIFIELTGLTPSEYIRKLKLSNAALRLRDEKTRIIDIVNEFGFNSVDGFQRAFYKEFGCNPKEYANNPIPLKLFIPYGVNYELKGEKKMMPKNIFVTVIEKPERKVIIKRGIKADNYFDYCNEVGVMYGDC